MGRIFFALITFTIIFVAINVFAGNNCTKDEIIKMINNGFSKSQIDDICSQPAYCCCKITKYGDAGTLTRDWRYKSTDYSWMKADYCNGEKVKFASKTEYRCTSKSYCGR